MTVSIFSPFHPILEFPGRIAGIGADLEVVRTTTFTFNGCSGVGMLADRSSALPTDAKKKTASGSANNSREASKI